VASGRSWGVSPQPDGRRTLARATSHARIGPIKLAQAMQFGTITGESGSNDPAGKQRCPNNLSQLLHTGTQLGQSSGVVNVRQGLLMKSAEFGVDSVCLHRVQVTGPHQYETRRHRKSAATSSPRLAPLPAGVLGVSDSQRRDITDLLAGSHIAGSSSERDVDSKRLGWAGVQRNFLPQLFGLAGAVL
jgi:hypothetical protein